MCYDLVTLSEESSAAGNSASGNSELPKFIKEPGYFSNRRYYVKQDKTDNLVFKYKVKNKPTYNAYEEDITIVNFYFDKSTILQFTRQQSMTIVDYISQLGGLLGLFLGFSFISGVELFYWLTIRLGKNIRNSNGSVNSDFKSSTTSSRASWIQVEEASTEINSIEK